MSSTRIDRLMIGASARFNYEWALRCPGSPPFIMMTEFPRSGGNWIRDMLSDALQIPAPRFSKLPITFKAIAHNHDHRIIMQNPVVYVYRDGRDVFLSHFHKTVTAFENGKPFLQKRILKLHPSLSMMSKENNRDAIDKLQFYDEWRRRPLGCHVNWGDHVGSWLEKNPKHTVFIRYEDMLEKPHATLTSAVEQLSKRPARSEVIDFAIWRNSFEVQTGRTPGTRQNSETKRSGSAGGWHNELPDSIKLRFSDDFGITLKRAGYDCQNIYTQ